MPDPGELISHWGYAAIFVVVALGNLGIPLPEEAILVVAGYLVWRGQLRLPIVLGVGIASAVTADALSYWFGRRFGRPPLERHAGVILGHRRRLASMQRFVSRHGPYAVFAARFIPGVRLMAGPLAGALGMRFPSFLAANLLGAFGSVPLAVGLGYAVGYELGQYVEPLRRVVGDVERAALLVALVAAGLVLGWRLIRAWRGRNSPA